MRILDPGPQHVHARCQIAMCHLLSFIVFLALRRNLAERAIDGVFNERGFSLDWAV